jgi:hypothetical protein
MRKSSIGSSFSEKLVLFSSVREILIYYYVHVRKKIFQSGMNL